MTNNSLEKFKIKYSEYIEFMVDMHNAYTNFVIDPSYRSFRIIRACLVKSRKLQRDMQRLGNLAFREEFLEKDIDRPISNFVKGAILKDKEVNLKIIDLLSQKPYEVGDYQKIADTFGVDERKIRNIHKKINIYKKVLLDDKQKQSKRV